MMTSAELYLSGTSGSGNMYVDLSAVAGTPGWTGKKPMFIGGSESDWVYVPAGVSIDFTDVGTGLNRLYLPGKLGDYTQTIDQDYGYYTLTRTVDIAGVPTLEEIAFRSGAEDDYVYFADGKVRVINNVLQSGSFREIVENDLIKGDPTPADPSSIVGVTPGGNIEMYLTGHGPFYVTPLAVSGQSMVVVGGASDETVYVGAGTKVDFSDSGTGTDRIYLPGKLSDYTQVIDQDYGIYELTRNDNADEVIIFRAGDDAEYVHFADGYIDVRTSSIKAVYSDPYPFLSAGMLTATDVTPPTATVELAITFSNDSGGSANDFVTNVDLQTISGTLSGTLESGEKVQVSRDGVTWIDATVTGTDWSASITLLDGDHALYVRTADSAGNLTTPIEQQYTLDFALPAAAINAVTAFSDDNGTAGDFITNKAAQTVSGTFTGTLGTDETLQISVDGVNWISTNVQDNEWSADVALISGTHTLSTRTIDLAGNITAGISTAYTLDQTSPLAVASILALNADNGLKSNDFITSNAAQKVSGSLDETLDLGEIVQVSVDGNTWIDATANGKSWFTHVTLQTGDGTLSARTIDALGNFTNGDSKAYTLETGAPTATVTEITALSADTNIDGDFITYISAQSISGKLDQTLAAGDVVQISANGTNWITAATTGLTWTADGVSLKAGTNTLSARVSDLAGNVTAGATRTYTLDQNVPTNSATLDPFSSDTGKAGDFITSVSAQTIGVSLSSALAAGENLQVLLDGASWFAPVVSGTHWSQSVTLPSGTHTITTRVMDVAGNFLVGTNQSFTLDTVPPSATVNQIASISDDTNFIGDFVTSKSTQTVSGTLTATLDAGEGVDVSADGTTWIPAIVSGTGWSAASITLQSGSHTLLTRTSDQAGNTTSGITQAYVLDQTNPAANITAISLGVDSGRSSTDFITATKTQTVSVALTAALDTGEIVQLSKDGLAWQDAGMVNATKWSASLDLTEGAHTLYARIMDLAGNTAGATTQAYTLDTIKPAVPAFDLQAASDTDDSTDNVTSKNELIFDVTGEAGTIVQLFNDTGNFGVVDAAEVLGMVTLSATTGTVTSSALPRGTYTQIKVMQTDTAGNQEISAAHPAIVIDLLPIDLQTFENGISSDDIGFVINGASSTGALGTSVAFAGDLNNDGYADLIVGAPTGGTSGLGYVVYGKNDMTPVELSSLSSSRGFSLTGSSSATLSGYAVSSAGDFNGDGMADVIIGSPGTATSSGKAYIVYGSTSATPVDLSAVGTTVSGYVIAGLSSTKMLGYSVSAAGDVNGDGLADVIVGAPGYGSTSAFTDGRSYVVFGSTASSGPSALVSLTAIEAGNSGLGFAIYGESDAAGNAGYDVSSAGDVNGDGYADLVIGEPNNINGTASRGRSFVIFGKSSSEAIHFSDIVATKNFSTGFVILGEADNGAHGFSVSTAGDVNGDGLADLIIGSNDTTANATGKSYVVFGKTDLTKVELSDVVAGTGGFLINGQSGGDFSGYAVSAAGDINGDGLDDLVVSSVQADPLSRSNAGKIYIVYGKTAGASVALSDIEAGNGGFAIIGATTNGKAGTSVAGAGDVDGDGMPDLIIGAKDLSRSYVLFSSKSYGSYMDAKTYTSNADSIAGTSGTDHIFAGAGNDTISAGGGKDVIHAGPGDDVIIIDSITNLSSSRLDGGTGHDKLVLNGSQMILDLTSMTDMALKGIEHIDITGSGNNILKLGWTDLLNITDATSHVMTIDGDAGDKLYLSGPGAWYEDRAAGVSGYKIYRNSQQLMDSQAQAPWQLKVDTDISLLNSDRLATPELLTFDTSADKIGSPLVETFENFDAKVSQNAGWVGGSVVSDGIDWATNFLTSAVAWENRSKKTADELAINDNKVTLASPTVYKAFNLSGTQSSVTLSFSFYEIDSWEKDKSNEDSFSVWVDVGNANGTWQKARFAFDQGTTRNTVDPITTGDLNVAVSSDTQSTIIGFYATSFDEMHTYTVTFNTQATWFKLGFSAGVDDQWDYEAWGVDDLVVRENRLLPAAAPQFEAKDLGKADTYFNADAGFNYNFAGGRNNDTLTGNAGDDVLVGGGANDSLDGGDGNDVLIGGRDNDILLGGKGDDTLIGGENGDTVSGGEGNDLLYVGDSDLGLSIDGGAGIDTLAVSYDTGNFNLNNTHIANIERISLNGSNANTVTLNINDVIRLNGSVGTFNENNGWSGLGAFPSQMHQIVIDGDTNDKLVPSANDRYNQWGLGGYVHNGDQIYAILNSTQAPTSDMAQILVDIDIDISGIHLDTVGPVLQAIIVLSSDNGRSKTDQITSNSALKFAVTTEFGAKLMFYNDTEAEALSGKLSLDNQIYYTSAQTSNLNEPWATGFVTLPSVPDGTYSQLRAKQWDMSDNLGTITEITTIFGTPIIVDTASPPAQIKMQSAFDSGRDKTDSVTSNTAVSFDVTSEPLAELKLMNGASLIGSAVTLGAAQSNMVFSNISLSPGTYSNIKIVATDVAGNVTTTTHPTIVIDTSVSAPTVTLDPASDAGQSSGDNKTNKSTPVFKVTGESGAIVTLLNGGTTLGEVTLSGTSGFITSSLLADGTYSNIRAFQTDLAGNTSVNSANLSSLEIETVAPSVPGMALTAASDSGDAADRYTTADPLVFAATGEQFGLLRIFNDKNGDGVVDQSEILSSITLSSGQTTSFLSVSALAEGTYANLKLAQMDIAGNQTVGTSHPVIVVDRTVKAPAMALDKNSDSGRDDSDGFTNKDQLVFTLSGEAGATVSLFNDTVISNGIVDAGELIASVTLSGTPGSDASATITTGVLAEGVYAGLKAIQTDLAGNTSPASASYRTITIDKAAPAQPTLHLDSASDLGKSDADFVTDTNVLVFYATAEVGSVVTLFADKNENGQFDNDGSGGPDEVLGQATMRAVIDAVTSSYLADGTYSNIRVIQTDLAGNTSNASDAHAPIVIDDIYAAAPVLSLEASADSGRLQNDRITKERNLVFTVTAEGGATVTLFNDANDNDLHDAGEFKVTVSVSGTPRIDTTATISTGLLAEGTYSHFKAYQIDSVGNVSDTSGAYPAIVIDATAPDTPMLELHPDSYAGPGNSISDTDVTSLAFNVTGETNAIVKLFRDSYNLGTADADEIQDTITLTGGATTATLTSNVLVSDTYSNFKVVQTDAAGNMSVSAAHPAITVTTAIVNAVSGLSGDSGNATDFLTNQATQTVSGTYLGTLGAMEKIEVSIDGSGWTLASAGSGAWNVSGFVLTDGMHTIETRTVDTAGSTRAGASHAYTLDTAAPMALVNSIDLLSADSNINNDYVTNVAAQTLKGTLSGPITADEKVEISFDGVTWTKATVNEADWSWSVDTALVNGTHTLQVRTNDYADNATAAISQVYTLDTVAPTAVVNAFTSLSSDTGAFIDFITNVQAQTVAGTFSTPLGADEYVEVSADGGTWTKVTPSAGSSTWTANLSLVSGTHTLQARTADTAGNTTVSATQSYTLDTTVSAPTMKIRATSDTGYASTDFITSAVRPVFDVTGDSDVASIALFNDADGNNVIDSGELLGSVTLSGTASGAITSTALPAGTYSNLKVMQTDVAGNSAASAAYTSVTLALEVVKLSDLNSGSGGMIIENNVAGSVSDYKVSSAGDINNDGQADLLVGAYDASTGAGRSYVVFGKTGAATIDLSAIDVTTGTGGFVIKGESANDKSGYSVSSLGDMNGDGIGDILIGAKDSDPGTRTDAGRSYVVFGKAGTGAVDLSAIAAGTGGFVINGQCTGDNSGFSVSAAGDVNGDGLPDLLVGAINSDPINGSNAGRSYVVFGKTGTAAVDLSAIAGGTGGFVINGRAVSDNSGASISAAGDVNGDGLVDFIVGAPAAGSGAGRSYVVFGRTGTSAITLSSLSSNGMYEGFVINGQCTGDKSGYSVSGAGDVNGDGYGDLIVGLGGASGVGRAYVVFGKTGLTSVDLSQVANGTGGFMMLGASTGDLNTGAVSAAGDLNGDGLADLIVGGPNGDPFGTTDAGRSYVVFGKTGGATVNLSALPASAGFAIDGLCANEKSGSSVASAGDVDGDGLADLIVSVNHSGGAFTNSRAYVIQSGQNSAYLASFKAGGTANADTITGNASDERIVAGAGNDTITSGGGNDVIYGGMGDDVIKLDSTTFLSKGRIDGGLGNDTLQLTGGALTLDLAATNDYALKGIEKIDLNTSGANTLKIKFTDLVSLMDPSSHKLTVEGDGNDTVQMQGPGAWVKTDTSGNYDIYGYSLGTGFDSTALKTPSIEQIWVNKNIKVNSSDTLNVPMVETFDSFAAGGSFAESGGWQGGIVVRDDVTAARSREFSNFLTTKTGYSSSNTAASTLGLDDDNGTVQPNGTTLMAPTVSKAFSLSGQQKWVEVSFSFYEINSWDNPEKFNVWVDKADDSSDWLVNPTSAQSYDGGSVQSSSSQVDDAANTGMKFTISSDTNANNIGFNATTGNEEFHTYTIAFQTTGSWFKLGFSASLNESWNNEAWGVDNLVIRESTTEPPPQIRGTTSGETKSGAATDDDITGGQGNDIINGLAGNDLLVGGLGLDTIDGGDGKDLVLGGRDADSLNGGNGDDTLVGGEGADKFDGGAGNDVLIVDADDLATTIAGGAEIDTLTVGDAGMSINLVGSTSITGIERVNLTGNGINALTLNVDDVVRLSPTTDVFGKSNGWADLEGVGRNQFIVDGESGDSVTTASTWTADGTTYHDGQAYAIFTATGITDTSKLAQLLIDLDISRTGFPA